MANQIELDATKQLPRYEDVTSCRNVWKEGEFPPITNPKFEDYRHILWTAGDSEDLENVFEQLNTPHNVQRCIRFIFNRYRTLFYVSINKNTVNFVPINNYHYINPYAEYMHLSPKIDLKKMSQFRPEVTYEKDKKKWYATGFLVRFDYTPYKPSDPYEFYYYEMQQYFAAIAKRLPKDLPKERYDFIIQYRDFQLLRENNCDPLWHIVNSQTKMLPEQPYSSKEFMNICPVLGFGGAEGYVDIPIPTPDDISYTFGLVVPPSCKTNKLPSVIRWEDRLPVAVFRGMATGVGLTVTTNARMKLWKVTSKRPDLFDVGLTGFPKRFKKVYGEKYIQQNNSFDYDTKRKIPIAEKLTYEEQFHYKMMIYVEGNSAAYRLGSMLASGCCILKVESKFKMWIEEYMLPWKHYVPVCADYSDLIAKTQWCKENDEKAKEIGNNARLLFEEMFTEDKLCSWFIQKFLN